MTDAQQDMIDARCSERGGPRLGHVALILLIYLALAAAVTYPLAVEANDHVFGLGTPPLNVWAIGWVQHQLPRQPLHLFDANVFHPYANTLAFSEHLLVPAVMGAPLRLVTDNLVLVHNLVALLTLALAGTGMYLLALHLTAHRGAAFAAGALYAFHTWNVNELIRLQILSNQWFPFFVLGVLLYFEHPTRGRAVVAGLFYVLQSLSCMYWALYLPLLAAPLLALVQWRARLEWRRLRPLGVSLGLALLITAVFFLPYLSNASHLGFERTLPGSIDMGRYLAVLPGNWLYGGLLPQAGPNADAAHFLGVIALGLAIVGAARGRFRPGLALGPVALLACAATGFVLSLGPEVRWGQLVLGTGPYTLLYEWMPGFRGVRYPERFSIFVVLGLAPLMAAGLARLMPKRPHLAGIVGVAIVLEHIAVPLQLSPLPAGPTIPVVDRWLATQDDIDVVAWLPSGRYLDERHDAIPMYLSSVHWKRTAQGFSGYFPPIYNFLRWRLLEFPSQRSVAFLKGIGVDAIVVRPRGETRGERIDGAHRADDCRAPRWRAVEGPFPDGSCVIRLQSNGRLLERQPTPRPPLEEVDRRTWEVVDASHSGAAAALDDDPSTSWTTESSQQKGDIYRIRFDTPTAVARVEIAIPPPFELPMHVRVVGYRDSGQVFWVPFDESAAYDELFLSLLHTPRDATLPIDLPDVVLDGLAIAIQKTDPYRLPWKMSELRVYTSSKRPEVP